MTISNVNKDAISRFRIALGLDKAYPILTPDDVKNYGQYIEEQKKIQFRSIYELYLEAKKDKLVTHGYELLWEANRDKIDTHGRKKKKFNYSSLAENFVPKKSKVVKADRLQKRIIEEDGKINLIVPKENASYTYRVFFFKAVFSRWLEFLEEEPSSEADQEAVTHYGEKWFQEANLGIGVDIIGNITNNPLSRLQTKNEWFDYILHSLRSLVAEDYNRDTLEMLIFLTQFIYYEELERDQCGDNKKTLNATITRLAYMLSKIVWECKLPIRDGIMLAKQGISLVRCEERQDAFNILGLLASDMYGKKQLSYDAYYSWLEMEAVGEIEQLIDPAFFKSIKQPETEWRKTWDGKTAMALMYNNFAYVCADIGEEYSISDPDHLNFYRKSANAARDAVSAAKSLIFRPGENDQGRVQLIKQLNVVPLRAVASYYCTLGSILSDCVFSDNPNLISEAIDAYSQLNDCYQQVASFGRSVSFEYWLNGDLGLISSILCLLFYKKTSDGNAPHSQKDDKLLWKKIYDAISRYYELDVPFTDADAQSDIQERENLRPVLLFLDEAQKDLGSEFDHAVQEIAHSLLIIWHCASEIDRNLVVRNLSPVNYNTRDGRTDANQKRSEAQPVAYYTTIQTASYIFDNLEQEHPGKAPKVNNNSRNGKNCLTVVHAKNMNDPYEGLTLLNAFQAAIRNNYNFVLPKGSEVDFRESLYQRTYVFLKSFTDNIDSLVMWNRYASDYDGDGHNSNGCCIEFAPECFHRLAESSDKPLTNSDDISQLYQVVYLSDNYAIDENQNKNLPEREKIEKYYEQMKKELGWVNQQVDEIRKSPKVPDELVSKMINQIQTALSVSLRKTMFLFKSGSYSEEHESRLIYTRNQKQTDSIRILEGSPKKLAINPFFQVYIKRIILGPNLRDSDGWKPYFQYQLSRMWEKAEDGDELKDSSKTTAFSIENSKIHYRT